MPNKLRKFDHRYSENISSHPNSNFDIPGTVKYLISMGSIQTNITIYSHALHWNDANLSTSKRKNW